LTLGFGGHNIRQSSVNTEKCQTTAFGQWQIGAPRYAMLLSEPRRGALWECIRAKLPTASDDTIDLVARAWAVRGRPSQKHARVRHTAVDPTTGAVAV
jgi:hypothetical protein